MTAAVPSPKFQVYNFPFDAVSVNVIFAGDTQTPCSIPAPLKVALIPAVTAFSKFILILIAAWLQPAEAFVDAHTPGVVGKKTPPLKFAHSACYKIPFLSKRLVPPYT